MEILSTLLCLLTTYEVCTDRKVQFSFNHISCFQKWDQILYFLYIMLTVSILQKDGGMHDNKYTHFVMTALPCKFISDIFRKS